MDVSVIINYSPGYYSASRFPQVEQGMNQERKASAYPYNGIAKTKI